MEPGDLSPQQAYRDLLSINRLITASLDPPVVLSTVTREAARLVGGDAAALLLREDSTLRVVSAYALEVSPELRMQLDAQVMGRIRKLGMDNGLPGYAGVPLVLRGETIGVLAVYHRTPEMPSHRDEELLSALADQAAIAVDNARIYHQLAEHTAALRENEERFRTALEEAPIGIALVALDGRYLRVNCALCEILGFTRDELMALTFHAVTHPDDIHLDVARIGQLVRGEVSSYQLTKRFIRKDGAVVVAVIHRSAVRGLDGRPLYFITHIEDVTEQERAERERAELHRRLQTVLDEAPVGILLTHDGRTWQANHHAEQLFGGPMDKSAYLDALLDADENPLPPEQFPGARALRGERLEGVELRVRQPHGKPVPILVNAAPIPRHGDEAGAVVAFENISTLKELERLRMEWSSVVAHDLRQPLNTIGISAEMAEEQARGNPAVQQRIAQIKRSVARLGRMIQDLLDFSNIEARQLKLQRHLLEIDATVTAAAERLGLETTDRAIEVHTTGGAADVYADPDRLDQILENLLSNAIKYGYSGTPIVVEVACKPDVVTVSVTNYGRGIAPDQLAHLFQRFHTVEEQHHRGIKRIGLGLYITRELVHAHGGEIEVVSTPGQSTTFRFTLPVASQRPLAPANEIQPAG